MRGFYPCEWCTSQLWKKACALLPCCDVRPSWNVVTNQEFQKEKHPFKPENKGRWWWPSHEWKGCWSKCLLTLLLSAGRGKGLQLNTHRENLGSQLFFECQNDYRWLFHDFLSPAWWLGLAAACLAVKAFVRFVLALTLNSAGTFLGVPFVITLFCPLWHTVIKCENSFKVICGLICLEMGEAYLRMHTKFRNRYTHLLVTPPCICNTCYQKADSWLPLFKEPG